MSMSSFVVLGVLARVDRRTRDAVEQHLVGHPGVSVFAVDDPCQMGILIEEDTLAAAEEILRDRVLMTPGVLGAWPVFLHDEPDGGEFNLGARQEVNATPCSEREIITRERCEDG